MSRGAARKFPRGAIAVLSTAARTQSMTASSFSMPHRESVAGAATSASLRFGWLREALLHFVLAGGFLFALDHFLFTRADDPRTIVVGADVDREAIDTF